MSIVDAIQRAKVIAKAQAEEQRNQKRARTGGDAGGSRVTPAPAQAQAPAVNLSSTDVLRFQPLEVAPDLSLCAAHRLLMPQLGDASSEGANSAYRMLRARLLQRTRAQGWLSVGLTSAEPGDGKSLTAVNLALSLAREQNNTIVLLDLDMRRPSVLASLGVTTDREISEYFRGTREPDSLFLTIGVPNLLVAGGRMGVQDSSELLSNQRLEALLTFIRESVPSPLIIVDMPPILLTDDPIVMAPRLDSILIVASEGKTDRAELQRAVDMLKDFRLGGYVLNRSSHQVAAYGYGYY